MRDFALNCSRIGTVGGLRNFAEKVMACLGNPEQPIDAVLPEAIPAPAGVHKIATPSYIGSASGVSLLRPIAWLAYSRFRFPVPKDRRVLATTHHVLPGRRNQIVTVHDIRPYFFPDSPVQRFYFHHMLPRALKQCDGVLTCSETSRLILMEVYALPESAIRIIPNAVDLHDPSQAASVHLAHTPSPDYLLMVGASWSHKNADEVMRMHPHWAKRFRLKIVAGLGIYRDQLQALAATLGIEDRVDFLTGIPHSELQSLYANCAAVVYPSKMEGFGLPPLEAMAYGRPVIVSDIPVFRELYGRFPQFVRLGDEASWEEAFRNLGELSTADAAQAAAHARSYNLTRMAAALNSSLEYFWG